MSNQVRFEPGPNGAPDGLDGRHAAPFTMGPRAAPNPGATGAPASRRRPFQRTPAETLHLGDVVRDTVDHLQVIARDSVALGKLELRQVGERVVEDIAPRAAIGLGALTIGLAGAVLTLIAVFMGFGHIIASVPWRLFIFGVVFLGTAALLGYLASRPLRPVVETGKLLIVPADDDRELTATPGGRELEIPGPAREGRGHSS